MKKKLGFKIVLSLTLVAATLSPTFAKPLVGSSCQSLGAGLTIKQTTYLCTKVGSKLLWQQFATYPAGTEFNADEFIAGIAAPNRGCGNNTDEASLLNIRMSCKNGIWTIIGIKQNVAKSPSSAGPLKTTDPLKILGNSIAVKSREQFLTELANASKSSPNIIFKVDPKLDPKLLKLIRNDTILSAQFWADLRPLDKSMIVYAAPTDDFQFFIDQMKPTLTEQGLEGGWLDFKFQTAQKEPGFYGGGAPAFDKDGNPVFMMYAPNNMNPGNGMFLKTTSHEYVHVVQRYLDSGNMGLLFNWEKEGQADFIGASFAGRQNVKAFAALWSQLILFLGEQSTIKDILNWNSDQFIQWFKDREITGDPAAKGGGDVAIENYIVGAMAEQWLYGTYGYKKVNQLVINLNDALSACGNGDIARNTGCPEARNKAFFDAFGINLSDFYPKVAPFIVSEIAWAKKNQYLYPTDLTLIK